MKRGLRFVFVCATFVAGVVTGCWTDNWFGIDSCLDGGGAWDYSRQKCRYQ